MARGFCGHGNPFDDEYPGYDCPECAKARPEVHTCEINGNCPSCAALVQAMGERLQTIAIAKKRIAEFEAKLARLRKLCGEAATWFEGRSEGFRKRCSGAVFKKLRAAERGEGTK